MAQDIWSTFGQTLNRHGYGFQSSVLNLAKKLFLEQRASPWRPLAREFPVEVQGKPTRIDIILQYRNSGLFMVVECKRTDPKFGAWCFARAPSVKSGEPSEYILSDHLLYHDTVYDRETKGTTHMICTELQRLWWPNRHRQEDFYHIGCPVKGSNIGESGQSGHDDIEKAATQVCRGSNGLIELVRKKPDLVAPFSQGSWKGLTLVPAIFTTANIWGCNCDLGASRLEDGKVELSREDCSQKKWVFLQYPISPGIKHSAPAEGSGDHSQYPRGTFGHVLQDQYMRTIPIVTATATGIEDFLSTFNVEPYYTVPF